MHTEIKNGQKPLQIHSTRPTTFQDVNRLALDACFDMHSHAGAWEREASLEKSETLFNSLLQRAFKGELTT